MKRFHWTHMLVTGTFLLSLGACTHKPTKPLVDDQPMAVVAPPSQQEVLLQEARMENEHLRSEIGALKILMAKQAGELRSLREQTESVHHREQDQGQQLQQIRSDLLSSQKERDQLQKRNMELEGQVASLPDTAQLVSDIQALSHSFQQIMTGMKQLSEDMILIKREMHITSDRFKPQQAKHTVANPQSVSPDQTPDAEGHIVIQNGDTLWKLARTYNVSIAQLKEWNQIEDSDLIMTGLRLRVAAPQDASSSLAPPPAESPSQPAPQEQVKEMVQPEEPVPHNRVENAPEPKHILSLGSPQSQSQESP